MKIISRKKALALGLSRFFTGNPCVNGHIAPRITKTYRCTKCKGEWEHNRRLTHIEQDRAIRRKESIKHRASYKRREHAYWKRLKETYGERYVTILRTEASSRRRKSEVQATPKWYDKEKVLEFYLLRDHLNKTTTILHEVDHIIPLRGKNVCGLHWHGNLQVITKEENNSKSNRL